MEQNKVLPDETETEEIEGLERTSEYRLAANHHRSYTNHAQVGISPWDIQIGFGEMLKATPQQLIIQMNAHITMTPAHAKVLAEVLSAKVTEYEQKFGPISDPRQSEAVTRGVKGLKNR